MRGLPAVERLAGRLHVDPPALAIRAARAEIAAARERILAGSGEAPTLEDLIADARRRAAAMRAGSLRRVINATGVVLHTNLGRAPLAAEAAQRAAELAAGYTNLELELGSGRRGSRQAHLAPLVRELTGAEAVLAVNNNAAAVLLALAALAAGREVVVGRGQLVEIGGSFRIPEILAQSGARLVEIGTTNRTRIDDYAAAIGSETAAILRVHQSNFRTIGFVEEVGVEPLAELARERGVALIDDLGSGALGGEPAVGASLAAGADLACFSADKLLGGPQAGVIAGRAAAVAACRRHPLARAVRIDKLALAALEVTLRLHRDEPGAVPALAMLGADPAALEARARRLAAAIGAAASVVEVAAPPGGGALPLVELPGFACALEPGRRGADGLAAALRAGDPPVVARIGGGRVLLDVRTIAEHELEAAAAAARAALAGDDGGG